MISPLFLFRFWPAFEDQDLPVVLLFADCMSLTGGTSVVESLELVPLLPSSPALSRPSLSSLWPLVSDWSCSSSDTTACGSLPVRMVDPRVSRTFGGCVAGVVPRKSFSLSKNFPFVSSLACLLVSINNFFVLLTKLFNFCTTLLSCFLYSIYYQVFC